MDWLSQLGPYQGFVTRTVAWWFVPGFATQTVLTLYYSLLSGFGLGYRIPANDSPKRPQHYRRAFALVVLSYLTWTLVSDLREQPASFYSLLGVDTNATDAEIKSAYKMFARRNHPDRVGAAGAPLFIQVRDAYEALKHPIKRYGYDRFGFDALEWKVAENPHAMLYQGLEHAMHYYVPTGLVMLVMALIGRGGTSAYWRYVTWAIVATLEACLIIGFNPFSSYSNPFTPLLDRAATAFPAISHLSLLPSMAPYQWVFFLRQLFVSVALALGQVVPVLFPPPPTQNEVRAREAEIARLAIALDPVVRQIIVQSAISDKHAQEILLKEVQYLGPPTDQLPSELHLSDTHRSALSSLAPAMQRLVVQQTLLNDPNLCPPFVQALQRVQDNQKRSREIKEALAYAAIGREELTQGEEDDTTARLLAIPSPPSSVFGLSRETTPERPSIARFDSSVPGFNYSASPALNLGPRPPSPGMNNFGPRPASMRRPSLSPSKRSMSGRSLSNPSLPFSPTSPIMNVKQELA